MVFEKDLHIGVRNAVTLIARLRLQPTPGIKVIYCRSVISRGPAADTNSVVVSRSIQFDERTTESRQLINALEGGMTCSIMLHAAVTCSVTCSMRPCSEFNLYYSGC